jgi:hypothetical protein
MQKKVIKNLTGDAHGAVGWRVVVFFLTKKRKNETNFAKKNICRKVS